MAFPVGCSSHHVGEQRVCGDPDARWLTTLGELAGSYSNIDVGEISRRVQQHADRLARCL